MRDVCFLATLSCKSFERTIRHSPTTRASGWMPHVSPAELRNPPASAHSDDAGSSSLIRKKILPE